MKQKKAATLLLTLLLIFALALTGCAQSPDPASGNAATPTAVQEAEPTPSPAEVFTPPPEPTPVTFPADGYIAKEGVNLRASADASSDIVDVLGENAPIHIVAMEGEWYQLSYNGQTAFVREDLAAIGAPPRSHNMYWAKVNVAEAQLYRSNSDLELSDRKLVENDVVKVLRTLDGYSHIVCDDHLQRYILATELTKITEAEAMATRAGEEIPGGAEGEGPEGGTE